MYDMYPEWGPAAHDEDHPANPVQRSGAAEQPTDLLDSTAERPDDN